MIQDCQHTILLTIDTRIQGILGVKGPRVKNYKEKLNADS